MDDLPELRSVDLDGPVRYREWGGPENTTFVLVHGLGGSHLVWTRVAPGLAGLGRVVALDLPGFGESPRAGRPCGLMDERRALGRFIASCAAGPVVLCGSSMGGALGIIQAAVEPGAVSGLVLTSSVFPASPFARPHPLVVAAFAAYSTPRAGEWLVRNRLQRMTPERLVGTSFRMLAADPSKIPEDVVRRNVELVARRRSDPEVETAFLEAARGMMRLGRRPDIARGAMRAVACPVLVIHGRRDRLVPVAWAEAAISSHPEWRFRFLPGVGHVPQLEAPGRWLSAVADWYAEAVG